MFIIIFQIIMLQLRQKDYKDLSYVCNIENILSSNMCK